MTAPPDCDLIRALTDDLAAFLEGKTELTLEDKHKLEWLCELLRRAASPLRISNPTWQEDGEDPRDAWQPDPRLRLKKEDVP